MAKVENDFSFSFPAECQEKSVPIQLQTLCSLLIDGSDPQVVGFSQASLSVAQLIMYQYRKTIPSHVYHQESHSLYQQTSNPC